MKFEEAVDTAQVCGVETPAFFGEVLIKIRGGNVTKLAVTQEFVGEIASS